MPEILYVEAWAEAAADLRRLAVIGRLLKIQNPKVVPQRPKYSTSRLPYFLRVVSPVGIRTLIEQMVDAQAVWTSIPQHHPYTNLVDLERVDTDLLVCVCVVVQHQPGAVSRLTQYGTAEVCNATVRQGSVTIRCSFWRKLAAALATHPVGSTLALHQVMVKKIGSINEWELRWPECMRCTALLSWG